MKAPTTATVNRPPMRALPPGKGRRAPLSPVAQALQDAPKPPWWDMPAGPERNRASMLWNCDEWHRQGRDDLARALSSGFKLGWKPAISGFAAPQTQQTAAMAFADTDVMAADYNPFAI